MAGFPSCIRVPADAQRAPWLRGPTEALVAEAIERGPGSDVVMARLSDALVTRALRYHLETADEPRLAARAARPGDRAGAHGAARRPRPRRGRSPASPARRACPGRRSRPGSAAWSAGARWTTPSGAGCVGPQALLRGDRLTVAAIASQVGYGSESALSAAFVRYSGTTPGAYRRRTVHVSGGHAGGVMERRSGPRTFDPVLRGQPRDRRVGGVLPARVAPVPRGRGRDGRARASA